MYAIRSYYEWAAHWQGLEAAMADGKGLELEAELLRRDGSRIWCQVIGRPLNAASAHAGFIRNNFV